VTEDRLYDESMYQFNQPEPSLWEATPGEMSVEAGSLDSDEQCEVAIIGGGYTGLSAAYHLARDFGIEARVLEAGHFGWGASGRNGGFCSIGGTAVDTAKLISNYGLEDVQDYYQSQVAAVGLVREIIREEDIDARIQGDAELCVAHSPKAFESMKQHAEMQLRHLKLDTEVIGRDQFRERYFESTEQYGATLLRPTFGLHPLRYLRGLATGAQKHGAKLHAKSEVIEWTKKGDHHILRTTGGSVRARYVLFATNGFMPENLQGAFVSRSLPVISAIVVTRPLSDDELAAHRWQTENPSINSRKLLNYFRLLPDKRFMFGGRGHSSGTKEGAAQNFEHIIQAMHSFWPEWRDVPIDYRWHGFVCYTRRMTPSIGRLPDDPSVFFGFGYHGNGVNTATWTGQKLASWLGSSRRNSDAPPVELPLLVQGLSPRFPFSALRLTYLQAAIRWYRTKERMGWS
jgi:glycine/D-amino acid oxidase-like deaminating enzyme